MSRFFQTVFGLAVFTLGLWIIYRELRVYTLDEILNGFNAIPKSALILALALTPPTYLLLTFYDWIALRYVGATLSWKKTAFAAFVGYAFSNSISMTPSMAIRYRLYSHWGVPVSSIARIILFHLLSTWLGFLLVGGIILLLEPDPISEAPFLTFDQRRWIGIVFLLALLVYFGLSKARMSPLRIRKIVIPFPAPKIVLLQTLVSTLDWALVAVIPFVLLPLSDSLNYLSFLGVFLLAQLIQIISHVPGGIGVFEGTMLLLLKDEAPASELLAALFVYRVIYTLLPLAVAALLMLIFELKKRRLKLA